MKLLNLLFIKRTVKKILKTTIDITPAIKNNEEIKKNSIPVLKKISYFSFFENLILKVKIVKKTMSIAK